MCQQDHLYRRQAFTAPVPKFKGGPRGNDLKWDQGALQLSERSYTNPALKDGGKQVLKGVGKESRDALRANNGEMALSEISDLSAKSHQPRDAIEALQNRGLVRQAEGMLKLTEA